MKSLLINAPILAFPVFDRGFVLDTDASGVGLGAVLAQKQDDGAVRPIAYASRTLQKHEQNYGVTELEALGVVWTVRHFRHYLYGYHCDVYTDHEALKSLLNTPHPSGKLARWGLAPQEVDLSIFYRPGKKNVLADALSRSPIQGEDMMLVPEENLVAAVASPQVSAKSGEGNLCERQRLDPGLRQIMHYLQSRTNQVIVRTYELFLLRNRICSHSFIGFKLVLVKEGMVVSFCARHLQVVNRRN